MFEKFVNEKTDKEFAILNSLPELSRESIIRSSVSEFSKNFLLVSEDPDSLKEKLKEKLSRSNKLYLNYTLRPKWTLITYLFSNFESRPPADLLKKIECFPFYKFYIDSIKDFISVNAPIFVTKTEVTSIIDNTNRAIYDKMTSGINNVKIKNFFLQVFLYKYENESDYSLESCLPYSFIRIFLEDKSYNDLEIKFRAVKNLSDESDMSLKDIIKVLTDKIAPAEKSGLKITEGTPVIEILPEEKQDIIVIKDSVKEKTEEKLNAEKIYSEELIKADNEKAVDTELTKEKPSETAMKIKGLFREKQLSKISELVYGSDMISMEKSFEKLKSFRTWNEASAHLKGIFLNNGVDIYNRDVISFVNTLNDYFKKAG